MIEQPLNLLVLLPLMIVISTTKIVLKLFKRATLLVTLLTLPACLTCLLKAQGAVDSTVSAPLEEIMSDTLNITTDSTYVPSDTNSVTPRRKKKSIVEEPLYYESIDTMHIVLETQKVYMYGQGKVKYQDFELKSEYIESDLKQKEVMATGVLDSNNIYNGRPNFNQGSEQFDSDSMLYNLNSGKGLIFNVKTEQGEGYLHSDLTKRTKEGHIHVKGGKYTTCDADHPHFYMELSKAIVIPNDKIISGPAYFVLEDIPLPMLGLPFGFFPNTKDRGAGILFPRYGIEDRRGLFFTDGGWYQPLGEYADLSATFDWYSTGSWGTRVNTGYKKRYSFDGDLDFNYAVFKEEPGDTNAQKNYRLNWSHRQDAKANPTQTFTAAVGFSSSGYSKAASNVTQEYLAQQSTSNVSYSKRWPGSPFSLSLSARASQNSADSTVTMELPTGSFSASTMYPFRRKKGGAGKYRWYENIGFSYNSSFLSKVTDIKEDSLFKSSTWQRDGQAGFTHNIPFVINLKTDKIKMLTISPGLKYEGSVNKFYVKKRYGGNFSNQELIVDTIRKVTYAHAISPSLSASLSPKLIGFYKNKRENPNVIAVRHVVQPRATFSYIPDMSFLNPNYYDSIYSYRNNERISEQYSYYENSLYKAPSSARESGILSLSLSNNLEMKRKAKNDTTGNAEPEKVVLLRNLNMNTSYNPFAEEYKWSDLSMNGGASFFKNKMSLNADGSFSFYDYDSLGIRIEEFYYKNTGNPIRLTRLSITSSVNLSSKKKTEGSGDKKDEQVEDNIYEDPRDENYQIIPGYSMDGTYVDFTVPWSLNVSYSWSLSRPGLPKDQTKTHTVGLNGDFSVTSNWRVGFSTGYDFVQKKQSFTTLSIFRDLHCWEMKFDMVPFGERKSFSFYIGAKSSLLSDLKYDKKKHWYDNF